MSTVCKLLEFPSKSQPVYTACTYTVRLQQNDAILLEINRCLSIVLQLYLNHGVTDSPVHAFLTRSLHQVHQPPRALTNFFGQVPHCILQGHVHVCTATEAQPGPRCICVSILHTLFRDLFHFGQLVEALGTRIITGWPGLQAVPDTTLLSASQCKLRCLFTLSDDIAGYPRSCRFSCATPTRRSMNGGHQSVQSLQVCRV